MFYHQFFAINDLPSMLTQRRIYTRFYSYKLPTENHAVPVNILADRSALVRLR